jgi:hypothetical protein
LYNGYFHHNYFNTGQLPTKSIITCEQSYGKMHFEVESQCSTNQPLHHHSHTQLIIIITENNFKQIKHMNYKCQPTVNKYMT